MGLKLFVTAALGLGAALAAEGPIRFNRDIRPIFSDACFSCHGPNKGSRMAGLRLDIREEALKPTRTKATPIVPGNPAASAVVQRIFSADGRIMPPEFSHKTLTEVQKKTIRQWIAEGAVYEGHWAYQPITRPAVPVLKSALVRNPIDGFIQQRLAHEGLAPSPVADKRTLLRRVTFDLTGLPPSPAEMAAFLRDTAPGAYERVVDRLLASNAYAEAQTVRWLDAVRYADSAGFHGDNLWPVWPYRDYVLRAFRDNKPFDVFTREQIAGDLLPNAGTEQKVASAYNRLNRASAEGGIQASEYLAKYGADRVRTLSMVWLGSTMGCAECHDHRFDPFPSKDFYSMKAFFADISETGLVQDRGRKAWGSTLPLASPAEAARMKQVEAAIEAVRKQMIEQAKASTDARWQWEEKTLAAHKKGELAWQYQRPLAATAANGTTLTIYNDEPVESNYYLNGSLATERKRADGLIVASGADPDNETFTVTFKPGAGTWTAFGIDVLQDESLPGSRLARGSDRFVLTEVEAALDGAKMPFVLATSTGFGQPAEHPAMAAIDGNQATGWGVAFGEHRNAMLALRLKQKMVTTADSMVTLKLSQNSSFRRAVMGRFRVALSAGANSYPETGDSGRKNRIALETKAETATLNIPTDKGIPQDVLDALQRYEPDRNDRQKELVLNHYTWSDPKFEPLTVRLAQLEAERDQLEAAIPRVLYTERTRPRETRVLRRGNFLDDSGEIVEPAIPAVFGTLKTNGRATRLDLANWLMSRDNPLTARAQVNRMWRQFFGIGLSKTLEDLGSQGEWPTHPELIDWLASEFMARWDVKHLMRTIVLSHTYQQASAPVAGEERDPDNRLLARQNRFRLDAEAVHDTALSIAGLLSTEFGGPSVRPAQPRGYLAAMNFPKREYSASHGAGQYRRGVYVQWQRTFLHPSLAAFDAPDREECTVNRATSDTPLQALVLLNDPIFVEASRVFAQNMLRAGTNFNSRLDWSFERALNRKPTENERSILAALYERNAARFRSGEASSKELETIGEASLASGADSNELAAMTTVARAILNLHETITRN